MFKSHANKSKGKKKKCDTGKGTLRNKNVFSELCAIHPQRTLDLFCSKCDKLYCRDCRETGSRECHKYHTLEYIHDVAYEFENSEEFKEYDTNIVALRKKLERSIEKTTENMKLSKQLQEEAETRIKQQKETLTELIETHYRKISKRNKDMNEDCLTKLTEILEQNKRLKAQFEDIENEMNEKKNHKMTALFIAIQKSREEVIKTEEEIKRLNQRNNVTRYVFEAGEQALTFMKNMEDFGDLVEESLNSGEKDNTFTTVGPLGITLDDNRRRENTTPQLRMTLLKPISRHKSLLVLPSQLKSAKLHEERVYSQPQFADSAVSMSSLQQLSKDSKESLNSSSGSSEAVPKDIPGYLKPKSTGSAISMMDLEQFSNSSKESLNASSASSGAEAKYKPGFSKPQPADSAISMTSLEQLSQDSKESLNSSSASSGAMPKYKPVRDTSPQDFSTQEPEQTIDNTLSPKLGPRPSALMIEQTTESKDFQDRSFASRTREPEMYKVWYPYTSDDESYLSCKKGDIVTVLNKGIDGIHWLVKLEGQVGLIRNDYLMEVSESALNTSVMDQLGGPLDHDSRIFDDDQAFDRTVRDPSPQAFSVPKHEQTIDSTGPTQSGNYSSGSRNKPTVPPKLGPKPSAQMIIQAREKHSLRDRSFARQTQPKPNKKYKVLYPFTTRNEEYLSYTKGDIVTVLKKCSGEFVWAELKGQCGYIQKDHLEEVVETGSDANVLSELQAKLRSRYSVS